MWHLLSKFSVCPNILPSRHIFLYLEQILTCAVSSQSSDERQRLITIQVVKTHFSRRNGRFSLVLTCRLHLSVNTNDLCATHYTLKHENCKFFVPRNFPLHLATGGPRTPLPVDQGNSLWCAWRQQTRPGWCLRCHLSLQRGTCPRPGKREA